jgi:hypothetical protein
VGNIRHQFAAFLILARQRAPLLAETRLHLAEGSIEYGDFIVAGSGFPPACLIGG